MNEIEKGQLAATTVQCFTTADGSLSNFPQLLKRVIEERVWELRMHNGRLIELSGLRELIAKKPVDGWGQDPDKIEAVIKDDHEVLAMFREAMKGKPGPKPKKEGDSSDANSIRTKVGSTQKAYLDERLKRDHPKTFQRLLDGEFKSTRAAAIAAGIVKVPTPLQVAIKAADKLDDGDRLRLMDHLKA